MIFLESGLYQYFPPEGRESSTREGPLDSLPILYVIDHSKLGPTYFKLFESPENLCTPKGCAQSLHGVKLIFFWFIVHSEN